MQAGVGLLVSDVMPIYMIIPRYSHNYAQFCQLLNGNLFTHRKILMLMREATSETYGPRVYFPSYIIRPINQKNSKISRCNLFTFTVFHVLVIFYIYLYLTFASDREGINNPFIPLVARFLFVCVGTR